MPFGQCIAQVPSKGFHKYCLGILVWQSWDPGMNGEQSLKLAMLPRSASIHFLNMHVNQAKYFLETLD